MLFFMFVFVTCSRNATSLVILNLKKKLLDHTKAQVGEL